MSRPTTFRPRWKRVALFVLCLFLSLFLLIGGLVVYVNTDTGKRQVSNLLTKKLGREVKFDGELKIIPALSPRLRLTDTSIANMPEGREPQMARIGELEVAISIPPLFIGRLDLPSILLRNSEVHLQRNKDGTANWDFLAGKDKDDTDEPATPPRIGIVHVEDSKVTILDAVKNIDVAFDASTKEGKVVLEGKGTYLSKAFTLGAELGSLMEIKSAEPYPVNIDFSVGHTRVQAKGSVQDPTAMRGMDITLKVNGADAAELFPLFGIALPPTPPYQLTGDLKFASGQWHFNKFKGKLGDSDLSGNLTWDPTGKRPKLTAEFISKNLYFKDLGPLVGVAPEKEEAVSAKQKAQAAKQEASPFVIPDVPIDISKLSAMDADVRFTGKNVVSPSLPLDDFLLDLTLDNKKLTIDPVNFGTANGDVGATIVINARAEPVVTDAHFRFKRLSLARLMEGLGKKLPTKQIAEGEIGGAAKLKGSGKSLRDMLSSSDGEVGIGMEGGKLSNLLVELIGLDIAQSLGFLLDGDKPVPVRCILADFTVEDGLMDARTFVIDTNDTNVKGTGTINLDGEKLDLRLKPKPKDTSLFSLRSPIRIGGTMKKPSVGIEPTNLAVRGVAATVASVALTPLVAIVAFIDPGQGKDSECAKLVAEMDATLGNKSNSNVVPKNPQ